MRVPYLSSFSSCCCCSVAKSCPTLCDPMDCSMPGFPVLHCLPEFAQTHVHWVSDANQPSHPLPPPSPFAFTPSQHQGLSWTYLINLVFWMSQEKAGLLCMLLLLQLHVVPLSYWKFRKWVDLLTRHFHIGIHCGQYLPTILFPLFPLNHPDFFRWLPIFHYQFILFFNKYSWLLPHARFCNRYEGHRGESDGWVSCPGRVCMLAGKIGSK